ncbi:MAG: hypothetical protein AB7Q00_14395 [Phycisphaerales bacterium]
MDDLTRQELEKLDRLLNQDAKKPLDILAEAGLYVARLTLKKFLKEQRK